MPRINEDPSDEVCPDYGAEEWQTVRQDLIDAQQELEPITHEVAAQRLRATWTVIQRQKIARWNQQKEDDQQRAEALREEEERRKAELDREAEEQRKEQEKKKPKINSLDPNCTVSDWIAPRPSAYALNKIQQIEYVELDYFTPKGCRQAYYDQEKAHTNDTFGLTHVDNVVAFQPISSLKPSKNIRRDEELPWDELILAKNTLINIMSKSDVWPREHTMSLAAFYVMLETHQMREREHGNKIMATYAGRVRREWFDLLKKPGAKVFRLDIINEALLRAIADEVKDTARAEEMKSVSTVRNLLLHQRHSFYLLHSIIIVFSSPSISFKCCRCCCMLPSQLLPSQSPHF